MGSRRELVHSAAIAVFISDGCGNMPHDKNKSSSSAFG